MRAAVATMLFRALPAAAEVTPATFERLNEALADEVAIPAYEAYAEAAAALPGAVAAVCADGQGLDAAQGSFVAMALAWQTAHPIALGPAIEGHGRAHIHWWPDVRGTGDRQLRRLLFAADEGTPTREQIGDASVATKGLSALEWLLFTQDLEAEPYACRSTLAVAFWQAEFATAMVEGWASSREELIVAGAGGSATHYDAADAAQAWLKSMQGTLDLLVRDKLEAPLGSDLESARPHSAELNDADLALRAIVANLITIRAMLAVPAGVGDATADASSGAIGVGLVELADEAVTQAEAIDLSLGEAVTDPATRSEGVALFDSVNRLRLLVSGPLAQELGLVTGFNAADGDRCFSAGHYSRIRVPHR